MGILGVRLDHDGPLIVLPLAFSVFLFLIFFKIGFILRSNSLGTVRAAARAQEKVRAYLESV